MDSFMPMYKRRETPFAFTAVVAPTPEQITTYQAPIDSQLWAHLGHLPIRSVFSRDQLQKTIVGKEKLARHARLERDFMERGFTLRALLALLALTNPHTRGAMVRTWFARFEPNPLKRYHDASQMTGSVLKALEQAKLLDSSGQICWQTITSEKVQEFTKTHHWLWQEKLQISVLPPSPNG